jgi:transglutaminase-like putative cysteine protease
MSAATRAARNLAAFDAAQAATAAQATRLRIGCELTYLLPNATPMILLLTVHHSRASDLERPDWVVTTPPVPIESWRDGFGNWCCRLTAPAGVFVLGTDSVIRDDGQLDPVELAAAQHPVEALPTETLVYLLGSRYCETDRLSEEAWRLFGAGPTGWARVQAICDFVHAHVAFGYEHSRPDRTAAETYAEGRGVCRDYAHLAIAFCRAMNIPARYCTGYLSDLGEPPPHAVMDFAAWIEVWLGGAWRTFDPRNNKPRQGRVLIAHGRDAADVPLTHTFGPNTLSNFRVWTDELGPVAPES